MKKEQGFTLIEVVASLVIITIILMFFSTIFVQNNKTSIRNSDKLVVTHIADAYLERLRVEKFPGTTGTEQQNYCSNVTDTSKKYVLNSYQYPVKIERKNVVNGMCNTVVTVIGKNGKTSGVVEGYVQFK